MQRRLIHSIVFALPVLLLLRTAFFCSLLWQSSYTQFLNQILQSIDRPDLAPIIRQHYFPETKYHALQISCSIALLLMTLLYVLMVYYNRWVKELINRLLFYGHNKVRQLSSLWYTITLRGRYFFILILIAILIRSLYYIFHFPIQYDEAWNANLFLRKSWYYSLAAYNNYPLHNVLTWVLVQGFGDSILVLRLPSVLAGLFTCLLIGLGMYAFTRRETLALAAVLLFACMPVSVFYMMYSRGVMFELSVAVLSLILFQQLTQKGISRTRLFGLALVQALGVLSMLSHIYFSVALSAALLFWLMNQRLSLRSFFFFQIGMIVFCFLFLLPMFLGTGIGPGWQAAVSRQPLSAVAWWQFVKETSSFVCGVWWFLPLSFFILPMMLFVSHKKQKSLLPVSLFMCAITVLLFVIPFSTHILPPPRALGFMVLIPLLFAVLFCSWVETKSKWALGVSVATMVIYLSYQSHKHPFLNWSYVLDKQVSILSEKMCRAQIHDVYNQCRSFDYFIPGITYYTFRNHCPTHFTSSSPSSTRYRPQHLSGFDCIVFDKSVAAPPGFFTFYSFDDIVIYCK